MSAADTVLHELDEAIRNRQEFERNKQELVDRQLALLDSVDTPADRYNVLRGLYDAYRSYKIDSAMIVAADRLMIARTLGEPAKIASSTLNLAETYAKAGEPDKAISLLDTLNMTSLEEYHLKYRLGIYRTAYESKLARALLPGDRLEALEKLQYYIAEAAKESPEGTRGAYTLKAEKLRNAGLYAEAVAVMEEACKKYDFSSDAAMQYTMGEIYLAAGERDKAVDCLARASEIDITNCVKEYRALILLASILFEEGDVSRAFNYINCAFDDADFSRASLRTAEVMRIMPVIDMAFHQAEQQITRRTRSLLILAAVLVLLLLVSLIFTVRAFRAKRRMLTVIADINAALAVKNEELVKADKLKLAHIKTLMLAYAGHITRFRDFRKTVYRHLKTSQLDNAMDMVKSDKAELLDFAAFHELFDKLFLSIFPDFVSETGRYMENPLILKTPDRLTPELRIAAMIRLGITSTEEIAELLHYTPQTVYNLRSVLKSMLKVSWKEFEAYLTMD